MKHAGKATQAALRLIYWTLFLLLALMLASVLAKFLGGVLIHIAAGLLGLWVLFGLFCFYFFRDPEPSVPSAPEAILAPAHGKVDLIEEIEEPEFMGGRCRRVSVFLSIFDVHVQRAPVAGRIAFQKRTAGQFLNAMRTDCADHNENVLVGFESTERAGEKVAIRLIAGLIARRIVLWTDTGATVTRGERVSLIQFGSRCDLLLPLGAEVVVRLGQSVRGGETVVARRS